jgi:hypothetical protein
MINIMADTVNCAEGLCKAYNMGEAVKYVTCEFSLESDDSVVAEFFRPLRES